MSDKNKDILYNTVVAETDSLIEELSQQLENQMYGVYTMTDDKIYTNASDITITTTGTSAFIPDVQYPPAYVFKFDGTSSNGTWMNLTAYLIDLEENKQYMMTKGPEQQRVLVKAIEGGEVTIAMIYKDGSQLATTKVSKYDFEWQDVEEEIEIKPKYDDTKHKVYVQGFWD